MTRPRSDNPETLRRKEVERQRSRLEALGRPRLQMMLIVALTGLGGFLASFVMLHLGVHSMALRYPLAVGAAYLVFLWLLWLWLRSQHDDYDCNIEDPGLDLGRGRSSESGSSSSASGSGDSSGLGDVAEALGGTDELALPLIALVLAAALLFAGGWIVYSAPLLFAELLVDGVLAASLYRRLKGAEPRHWLETAFRRTVWPFAATALLFCIAGVILHHLAPEARSIGDVKQNWRAK
ncbi:MAG: hypothetical protein NFW16_19460 [Candidatus Accumulibacter sp.]|uniref:hypothetical protein n=1 Tax=Accumulibacter sp. TaxID=2053492 RepID=UPI00258EE373|nr:hypothetical protein [Accumulibacter sp.]MCM8623850.1 hypothetical protein [Accumulibacter sp.]